MLRRKSTLSRADKSKKRPQHYALEIEDAILDTKHSGGSKSTSYETNIVYIKNLACPYQALG